MEATRRAAAAEEEEFAHLLCNEEMNVTLQGGNISTAHGITNADVLFFQTGDPMLESQPGNQRFRKLVEARLKRYYLHSDQEALANEVVGHVLASKGRFLDAYSGKWRKMTDNEAKMKTCEALCQYSTVQARRSGVIAASDITHDDVLCFQVGDQKGEVYPGNQRLGQVIGSCLNRYCFHSDQEQLVNQVVGTIRASNGRFLKKAKNSGGWQKTTDDEAKMKAREALHHAAKIQAQMSGGVAACDVAETDVLCFQVDGQSKESYPGYQTFQRLVKKSCTRYDLSDFQKIRVIRQNTGRFLQLDERSGVWHMMQENAVEAKILAALYGALKYNITDSDITISDVLCDPDAKSNFGNQTFQELVETNCGTAFELFVDDDLDEVIKGIHATHGRFLKKDCSGMWQVMNKNEVEVYTRQALVNAWKRRRENNPVQAAAAPTKTAEVARTAASEDEEALLLANDELREAPTNSGRFPVEGFAADNEMLLENNEYCGTNNQDNQAIISTVHELRENDVLCDQSGHILLAQHSYSGLGKFQDLMRASSGLLSQEMVKRAIGDFRASDGRFLKNVNDAWHQMDEEETAKSVHQAFSSRLETSEVSTSGKEVRMCLEMMQASTVVITDYDVLSFHGAGQGQKCDYHPGNQRFQELVMGNRNRYLHGNKEDTVNDVLRGIAANGGRFLKNDEDSGLWHVMTESEMKTKAHTALRQAATKILYNLKITHADVLTFQGTWLPPNVCDCHPGNRGFQELLKKYCIGYYLASNKQIIVDEVIGIVRVNHGRFLNNSEDSGLWHEMTKEEAQMKTHAALRMILDNWGVTNDDVLTFQGTWLPPNVCDCHPGNRRFQELVKKYCIGYSLASDKQIIVDEVIRIFRAKHGRFLKNDKDSGLWLEMMEEEAKIKTHAALRKILDNWDITTDDVLTFQGTWLGANAFDCHPGNRRFQGLIKEYCTGYSRASDKQKVVDEVIGIVRANHCRFLIYDDHSDLWHEMTEKEVKNKTRAALQEACKILANWGITNKDVVVFPGFYRKYKSHPGSQRFLQMVKKFDRRILLNDRKKAVKELVGIIREDNGRFFKYDSGAWLEMTEEEVEKWTNRALSNHASELQGRSGRLAYGVNDVLWFKDARSGKAWWNRPHPGNQKLHKLVTDNCERYILCNKAKVVDELIEIVRSTNGRFLKIDEDAYGLIELIDSEVKEKMRRALCEAGNSQAKRYGGIPGHKLGPSDVLCVPGFDTHWGNRKFQEKVEAITRTHGLSGDEEVMNVISGVRENRGRFLKKGDVGTWVIMDEGDIKDLTLKALNDALKGDSSSRAAVDTDATNDVELSSQEEDETYQDSESRADDMGTNGEPLVRPDGVVSSYDEEATETADSELNPDDYPFLQVFFGTEDA